MAIRIWTPESAGHSSAVAVYVKFPEPGKVKTRLARDIGEGRAAEAYAAMTRHLFDGALRECKEQGFDVVLCSDPFRALHDYEECFAAYPFRLHPQQGKDLGERLGETFRSLLSTYDELITIGTDCPEIRASHIVTARHHLRGGAGLVLGPARDGGYYLIGMKHFEPRVFDGIAWSSDAVFRETLQRATERRLEVALLDTLRDIDTREDLARSEIAALRELA